MQMQWKFGAVALLALAAIAALGALDRPAPDAAVSNNEDTAIRSVVTALGAHMKEVSLLSPTAAADMQVQYGSYVTPELLAQWQARPAEAPGRQTSSPWPDRIEITDVSYKEVSATVRGNVVEVANSDVPGAFASMYPVTIGLEKRGNAWLISSWSRYPMQELPERVSVVGYWECLPHKDTGGPQTEECALGIAIDQSDGHYAVSTALMAAYPADYQTGERVRVAGPLVPPEPASRYDTDGTIWATSIERL
jgi:hypothetical protein